MTPLDAMTCREAFARLDDYLDRELGPDELVRVEEHLEICEICASEFSFEERVLGQIREKLVRDVVPGGLRDRVAKLIAAERSRP